MFLLKLLQNIPLLLLITRQPTHLLLPLIIHHLLDHCSRLAIQLTQRRVLRRNLRNVDLRRTRNNMRPPLHLVHLVQVDRDFLAGRLRCRFKGPGAFVGDYWMRKLALKIPITILVLS